MVITSTVYLKLPPKFNMVGQVVSRPLKVTGENISPGMIKRLSKFALKELIGDGFECCRDWDINVNTMDADLPPSERIYTVMFTNPKGGYIEVCGILTRNGWPSLHHGYSIGQN